MQTEFATACPLDCPDTCSLIATIEDGRLISVGAAPSGGGNPFTQGYICQKVKHHARRVYAPERITTPLIRAGSKGSGEFREASWDEAIGLVAERIRSAIDTGGPDSVLAYLYNSSAGAYAANGLTPILFEQLGTPEIAHTICAATAGAAWTQAFGSMLSTDPLDIVHARLIVVWGANPTVSNTHLLPLINHARRNGAVLVVIDPRRTGIAARADLHLPIVPGTDVLFAYAAASRLAERGAVDEAFVAAHVSGSAEFLEAARAHAVAESIEACGISSDDFDRFVDLVATKRPATLRIGWGLERNRNGGSGIIAAFGLWALAGHFGVLGSGVCGSTSDASPFDADLLRGPAAVSPPRSTLSMNDVGTVLCGRCPQWTARPHVLFVQGANPAVTSVDQATMLEGLAREDVFTVVHEQVMTDTAAFADVVLPATTHFEESDVAGSYGTFVVQRVDRLIAPIGESKSNNDLAVLLAGRLGLDPAIFAPGDDVSAMLAEIVSSPGVDGTAPTARTLRPAGGTIQFVDTFPDGDGRIRLLDPASELPVPAFRKVSEASEAYPLVLLSPATNKTINSMFAEFDAPDAVLSMNPHDAAVRGVDDGDDVLVFNAVGRAVWPMRVDASLRPGVCHIPKGLWRRHTRHGFTANQFVDASMTDLAGGACFNDARVDVCAIGEGAAGE